MNWKRKIFTLIELLLVVAIIAILASMLLPALQNAKHKVHERACTNNIKNIYTASSMYFSDFDGWIPDSQNWGYRLIGGGYLQNAWSEECAGVYNCPMENRRQVDPWTVETTWWRMHYGLGTYMVYLSEGPTSSQWGRIEKIPRPSAVAYLGDKGVGRRSSFTWELGHLDKFRHSSGMNSAFVDGHSEWRSVKEVPTQETDSTPYKYDPFWGHPLTVSDWK